ncbi:MAG: hypothetical protein JNL19_05885 [Burkholderiales bacterium]|nr:hypothetical protein [Burkholderiales bacterium]
MSTTVLSTHRRARVALVAPLALIAFAASASDVWVYGGRDFTGPFARLSRSEANLPIGAARSVRVATGVWEACSGINYSGECRRLTPGDYRAFDGRFGDYVQSLRDVTYATGSVGYAPPRIQLYEYANYSGRTVTLDQSSPDVSIGSRRAAYGSAIVTGGTWEACTEYNFTGRCQALPPGQYNDLSGMLNGARVVSARVVDAPRPAPQPSAAASPGVSVGDVVVGALGAVLAAQTAPATAPSPGPAGPGWSDHARVEVYTDPNFGGYAMTVDNDTGNLSGTGFNDRIQSMRIFGGNWEACEHADYGGACMVFGPGDYRRLPPQLARSISSLRRVGEPNWANITPAGGNYVIMDNNAPRSRHPVWLFEHNNFNGRSLRATGDVNDLASSGLNDATSSIFISFGTWQFCEDSHFRGRCLTLGPGQYNDMPPGMNDVVSSFRRVR